MKQSVSAVHTVASLDPKHGGPSRSVPTLVSALLQTDVGAELSVWEGAGRSGLDCAILNSPSLLHDHGLWLPSNHASATAARRAGIPLVVSPRGMLEPWAVNHKRLKKWLAWHLYQRRDLASAALLHATSEAEAEGFRGLELRQPIAVIPNGVDLPPPCTRLERQEGLRTALFLSRLSVKKGIPHLLEAWAQVRPEGWRLRLVGPSENGHRAEMERLARALGLDDVAFEDPVYGDARWDVYADADLFVLPTLSENFGLVVAEALAAGVPVITTKAAPWAALEAHRCGWWVDIGVEPLAAALVQATSASPDVLHEMGARGRAYVEAHLGWGRIAESMETAYRWLLHGGPVPNGVHLD